MQDQLKELELSTQILVLEAERRGIEVDILDRSDNFIRLKQPRRQGEKIEYIKQATRTAADSYIAALIMENKEVTKQLLREQQINVPAGIMVHRAEEASEYLAMLVSQGKGIVIKPKSTNFGQGVAIFKTSPKAEELQQALVTAFTYDTTVLIEEFIPGREYRFLVIGNEVAAVLHRVPANVTGDGRQTIAELVNEKNTDPLRGHGYVTPLEKIQLGIVEQAFLQAQGKSSETIPQAGETVYLRENSNISTGGDSIDFTDEMEAGYKTLAVKAAQAVGAKICGADIIVQDIKMAPDAHNYSIIELNFNPALHIHDFPYRGSNRHVEAKVLDLLGF